jgi:hypothetical protein
MDRGGQRRFHAFLANLLRNALGAAGVQLRGIGALRVGVLTLGQQLLELIQEQPLVSRFAEAAGRALVAGWANRINQRQ